MSENRSTTVIDALTTKKAIYIEILILAYEKELE